MQLTLSAMVARQIGQSDSGNEHFEHVHRCLQGINTTVLGSSVQMTQHCSSSRSCRFRHTSSCLRCTLCNRFSKRQQRRRRRECNKASNFASMESRSSCATMSSQQSISGGMAINTLGKDGSGGHGASVCEAFHFVVGSFGVLCAMEGPMLQSTTLFRLWPYPFSLMHPSDPYDSSSATTAALSGLSFTAKATSGVHCNCLRGASGLLMLGDGSQVGSTRNSNRLRSTSSLHPRAASHRESHNSCGRMKGLV
mmetsp:Transcript_15695/g.32746  ORF Transcript_15695/g.32746 Transcript_15695/m.32746 type:complete len:252 (-) Transcript_15695:92-847(-)